LAAEQDCFLLQVTNDGRAFPDYLPLDAGVGLQIMQYRAGLLGGRFYLRRCRGGTTIACSVPRRGLEAADNVRQSVGGDPRWLLDRQAPVPLAQRIANGSKPKSEH
jgi:hypothetical protein